MARGKANRNNSNESNSNSNDDVDELRARIEAMEKELKSIKNENEVLEGRVAILEDKIAVSCNTSLKLRQEVDRLDQYQRRSNILLKNVELGPTNSQKDDKKLVQNLLQKELKVPKALVEVDKLHRMGRTRTNAGKKTQDIIVRFKSHAARYDVYEARKKATNLKIRPNLTKRRGDLLYRASKLVEGAEEVHFVFANAHGDLKLRLKEKPDGGEQYHSFSSIEELKKTLEELNIEFDDDVDPDDVDV